jgi:hypothetical protein
MSCSGKGYGKALQSNAYLLSHFSSFINQNNPTKANNANNTNNSSMNTMSFTQTTNQSCRQSPSFYPSFNPNLSSLSVTDSSFNAYSLVYVNGSNFVSNSSTSIQFGNIGYIPTVFYSSFNLSFVVPLNAPPGNYDVKVVNIYNGNFSPNVNQSYAGNPNFSEAITYTIHSTF